jgi:hypothetical protein
MKQQTLAASIAAMIGFAGNSYAGPTENRLETLEQRLDYLEQRVRDQDKALADKDRQLASLRGINPVSEDKGWFNRVQIGGVVEIEAAHRSHSNGDDESDITVPTAELDISAEVNSWVTANLALLYEDDGDSNGDLNVDTASVTVADPDSIWFVTAGQYTLPFGVYPTNMVSDPLTLELGETADAAIEAGFSTGGFTASVFVFEGDQGDDREIDNYGATINYAHTAETFAFEANLAYLNDIAESDAIVDDGTAMTNRAGAWVVSTTITAGAVSLSGEYLAATEALDAYGGEKPSAFNIEAAYGFEAIGKPASIAIGYQGTDEAENVAGGLAESRVIGTVAMEVATGTTVSLEYAHDKDYAGEHSNTLTGQLAVEF